MKEIDTTAWADFRVGSLFEVVNGRKYPLTWRVPGDIPLVSTSRLANGVSAEVGFPEGSDYVTHSNLITVAYSGSVGATFYHEGSVFVGETVMGLLPRQGIVLTKAIGLFLAAVIEASVSHFTYEHKLKVSDMRERISIRLPITSSGDPDWDYMEQTMCDVFAQQERELDELVTLSASSGLSVDTSGWGEFRVGELFDVVKGSRLRSVDRVDGEIPYIGATLFDNGYVQTIGNDESLHPGGVLTACYNGRATGVTFYQPEQFWATDDVNVLYPKFEMGEEIGLFIAPVIQSVGMNFGWESKWNLPDMIGAIIRLPVTSAGDPDWDYMEQTMRNTMAEREAALDSLQALAGV